MRTASASAVDVLRLRVDAGFVVAAEPCLVAIGDPCRSPERRKGPSGPFLRDARRLFLLFVVVADAGHVGGAGLALAAGEVLAVLGRLRGSLRAFVALRGRAATAGGLAGTGHGVAPLLWVLRTIVPLVWRVRRRSAFRGMRR